MMMMMHSAILNITRKCVSLWGMSDPPFWMKAKICLILRNLLHSMFVIVLNT